MENLINDDLDLSSSDNESDNECDRESDNGSVEDLFIFFINHIQKKMEIKKLKDSLIDLKTISEVMEKIEIIERLEIEKIEEINNKNR